MRMGMGRGGGCIEVTLGRSHLASHSALGSATMRGPMEPRSAGSGTTEMENLSRSIGTPFGSSQARRTRFPCCEFAVLTPGYHEACFTFNWKQLHVDDGGPVQGAGTWDFRAFRGTKDMVGEMRSLTSDGRLCSWPKGCCWCPEGDLNPHDRLRSADFKSAVSADFTIRAAALASAAPFHRKA